MKSEQKKSLFSWNPGRFNYPRIVEFDTPSGDHYRAEPCGGDYYAVYRHERGVFVLLGTIRCVGRVYPSNIMKQIEKEINADMCIEGSIGKITIKGDRWQKNCLAPYEEKEILYYEKIDWNHKDSTTYPR